MIGASVEFGSKGTNMQSGMSGRRRHDLRREFEERGREQVRSELRQYPPEKRREARMWLEQVDAASWQRGHVTREKESLLRNKKILKFMPFIGAAGMLIFALARWLH